MRVFRIEVKQFTAAGYVQADETFDISAHNAHSALRRLGKIARGSGFLKTRPLEVRSLTEIVSNLR